jgi:hypothetical protein
LQHIPFLIRYVPLWASYVPLGVCNVPLAQLQGPRQKFYNPPKKFCNLRSFAVQLPPLVEHLLSGDASLALSFVGRGDLPLPDPSADGLLVPAPKRRRFSNGVALFAPIQLVEALSDLLLALVDSRELLGYFLKRGCVVEHA